MSFTGEENHEISFEDAAELTKNYRDQMSLEGKKGGYFSRSGILSLLEQDGCVGIRYYYGLTTEESTQVLVMVGVNENENDLIGGQYVCIEMSIPCPSVCGANNILNSDI